MYAMLERFFSFKVEEVQLKINNLQWKLSLWKGLQFNGILMGFTVEINMTKPFPQGRLTTACNTVPSSELLKKSVNQYRNARGNEQVFQEVQKSWPAREEWKTWNCLISKNRIRWCVEARKILLRHKRLMNWKWEKSCFLYKWQVGQGLKA